MNAIDDSAQAVVSAVPLCCLIHHSTHSRDRWLFAKIEQKIRVNIRSAAAPKLGEGTLGSLPECFLSRGKQTFMEASVLGEQVTDRD